MKVCDVMTSHTITVRRDANIADAARLMLDCQISGLAVVDAEQNLVGVITEADIMRRSETDTERRHSRWAELFLSPARLAEEFVRANSHRVADVMSAPVISIDADKPLEEAVSLLEKRRVKRIMVTHDGKLCGVLSRKDLLRAFFEKQAEVGVVKGLTDSDVRAAAIRSINRQTWSPGASVRLEVKNGHASLSGRVVEDSVRKALRIVLEEQPGISAIDDHNIVVEPVGATFAHVPTAG